MGKPHRIMLKLGFLLGACVGLILLLMVINLYHIRDTMMDERKATLNAVAEAAQKVVVQFHHDASTGKISVEEAKARARHALSAMRYGHDGYVFAMTTEGQTMVHPHVPYSELAFDTVDRNGIYIIREVIRSVLYGNGYAYYEFSKLGDNPDNIQKKLSYSVYFQPWDWIIGTGVYVNDIEEAFKSQILRWLKFMTLPLLFLLIGTYFLGRTIYQPIALLEKEKEKAEAATRAKSHFLANVSHEIRTPLNGLMGMLSLIKGTKLTPQQREWAISAHTSSEDLLRLINDILDLSNVEAQHMKLESTAFDLQTNLKEVTDVYYPRAAPKGVELYVDFKTDLPRMVVGDPVRLRQILANLVDNAIKFTDEGSIKISVDGKEYREDVSLTFEVKDTGIGIPESKKATVFEKFSQAENAGARSHGGTGLGLAISHKLVELMGGEIGVRTVEGEGSTFWFNIRLKKDDMVGPVEQHLLKGRNVHVLIGNKKPITVSLIRDYLLSWECHYDDLSSGLDVMGVLQQGVTLHKPYSFVVVDSEDMGSTAQDISSFSEKVWSISPETRVIALARPEHLPVTDGVRLKQHIAILTKPVFPQDLWDIMVLLGTYDRTVVTPSIVTIKDSHEHRFSIDDHSEEFSSQDISQRQAKVLLVEDQVVNQMMLRAFLVQCDCDVDIANNGREAVQMAVKKTYDIIFMDCHMPEMDGYEAAKQIRAFEERLNRHVTIVALTVDSDCDDCNGCERCLVEGMDDCIDKPVRIDAIKNMLQKHVYMESDNKA